LFNNDNSAVIVNNFLKEYPKLSTDFKLAHDIINVNLINKEEFAILTKIQPTKLELPIKDKNELR
jgi:hypothetical protein